MRAPTYAALLFSIACSTETTSPTNQPNGSSGTQPPPSTTGKPVDPGPVTQSDWPENTACTGQPGEIYEFKAKRLFEQDEYPLCAFKGRVLLVFNAASYCGYTFHYESLQRDLYAKYKSEGLSILSFPSDTFNQEGETSGEISDACLNKYGVKFPVFAVAPVKGPQIQPVFAWLTSQPGATGDIPWNFEKFLVSRAGKVVKRFAYTVDPNPANDPQIENAIKAELAK